MSYRAAKKLMLLVAIVTILNFQLLPLADLGNVRQARAANLIWDPNNTGTGTAGGSGTWDLNTTSAWFPGAGDVLWTDSSALGTDTADFAGTAGTVTLTSTGGNFSALGLIFGTTGYTLSAGGATLNLGASGIDASGLATGTTNITGVPINLAASQNWNIGNAAAATLVYSGSLTNSSAVTLTKLGAGVLTLSGDNSAYTGGISLSAGTLNINSTTALGTGTFSIGAGTVINNGSGAGMTLTTNNPQTWNGSFTFTGTNTLDMGTGTVTLAGSAPTVTVNNNSLTIEGNIAASPFALTKAGNGTLTFLGTSNGYTGGTILNAGAIAISNDAQIPGGVGSITWGGGALEFNNYTTAFVFNNIATNLRLGAVGASSTIPAGAISGTSAPTFVGPSTLILAGNNSYSGVTNFNGGVVQFSALTNLGTNTAIGFNGGTLQYNGNTDDITTRTVTLNAGGGTIDLNGNNNITYNNLITGTGGLSVSDSAGAATLQLNAANTFGGTSTINAGATVKLGNALAMQNTTLNLNGGSISFNNFTDVTLGGLAGAQAITLANDSAAPVNLTINGGNGGNYSGNIGGTGVVVTKTGVGTQTISGANSLTNYVVNAGTLAFTTAAQTTNADFQVKGGTLSLAIGQGPQSTFELYNGATLTTTQSLVAGHIITAVSGTSTFTTTALSTAAVFNATFAGSGNINLTFSANLNTDSSNMLSMFGGVISMGASNNFARVVADTTAANFLAQYATLDLGTGTAAITVRNAGDNVQLGAISGGANTIIGGTGANFTIGSNNASTTFAGKLNNAATTLTKVGTGTLTLTDASAGAFSATTAVTVNGGTLKVDYSTNPGGVFATEPLNIGGGSLYLLGKNTGATTQTLGNLTLTGAGGSSLIVDPNGGTSTTLTLGTLTAAVNGGTLNIQPTNIAIGSGTATITTTTNVGSANPTNTNSAAGAIYSPRFTYGSDWATTTTAATPFTMTAYGGYNNLTTTISATDTTNDRLNDVGNATLGGNFAVNSLKITNSTSQSLNMNGNTLTVTSGGLLFTGSQPYSIGTAVNNGTLKSATATNSDLILQQLGTGNLTINSVIANGTGTSIVTKAGFGTVTLTGTNTYTGVTDLTGGTLSISSNANLGAVATGAAMNFNGGILQATSSFTLDNAGANKRNAVLFGGGGTIDVTGSNNLTLSGVVSENNILQFGSLTKTNTGTLTLTGLNTYGGATVLSGGVLSINTLANGGVIAASGSGKTTTNGSPTVSILNTTGISIGQSILGNGIPANAIVSSITPNTSITFTVGGVGTNANASGTFPLTFFTPNALGSSPNVADALIFNGGTLQYTGPAASTDRNFTLTNNGGTIDGSGSGAMTLSNTAPIVATGSLAGSGTRNLTLTGSTASNVFAGQIVDGTGGATSLTKAGTGSWTITNSHSYTGNTTISGGTLLLSHATSTNPISTSANINVGSSGILDVTGLPSGTIKLSTQTLTGAGTVTGKVESTITGLIKPGTVTAGSAGTGTMTIGTLTLDTGTTLNFGLSSDNLNGALGPSANLISTGTLTLPSSGTASVEFYQPNTNNPFLTAGTYDLIHFTSLTGTPSSSLVVGSQTGSGAFSYTFGTSGNYLTVTLVQVATAASWNVDADGNWTVPGNWTAGPPGTHVGDAATFGPIITSARTVTVNADQTVGQMVFNNSAASYNIAEPMSGGPFTITIDNGGGSGSINDLAGSHTIGANLKLNASINVAVSNANDTMTISGTVNSTSGTPSLTKSGPGTLILSNTGSTYAGSTNVNGGVLQFSALGSLGSGTAINFGGGALKYASGNVDDISNRTVTINAGGATLDTNGNNVPINHPIGNSGSGALTKIGAGTLTFAPAAVNTFTGNTTVSGGTVNFSALSNFGAGTGITVNSGGTLQWATGTSTNISTRTVTIGAGGGTFDANGNALSFTGAIGNSGSGALALSSSAANGSFTFGSASTYTGGTTINAVPVTLNDLATLGSGNIAFQGTTGSLTSNYGTANRLTLSSIDVASGVVGTVTGSNRTALTGLTGSGTLNLVSTVLATTGTSDERGVAISGAGYNTFTGMLNLSSSSAANNEIAMWFNGAGTNFNGNMATAVVNMTNNVRVSGINATAGNTWTVGSLSSDSTTILAGADFGGGTGPFTVAVGGTLNSSTTLAGTMVNGATGPLALTKQGIGTLTLTNGSSTYTGATTISAGTLKVMNATGSATGGSAVAVNSTGTLAGTGFLSSLNTPTVTANSGGHIAPGDPAVPANQIGTLTIDTLTLNAGSLFDFEFGSGLKGDGSTNNDQINVTALGGLNIVGSAFNLFNTSGGAFSTPGTYDVLQYNPAGGAPNTSTLGIGNPQPNTLYSFGTVNGVGPGNLSFVTLAVIANPVIYWALDSNGTWDTSGVNAHWSTGTNPSFAGAQVAFDETHTAFTAPHTVTLVNGPTVGTILFNSAQSFSITGSSTLNIDNSILVGSISDTKGSHLISAPVSYQAVGLNVSVTNAADSVTLSGGLTSTGPLAKSGSGTLALTGDDTGLSGNTTVSSGTLLLGHTNALLNSRLILSGGTLAFTPGVGTFHIPQIGGGTAAQSNISLQDNGGVPAAVNLAIGGTASTFTYAGSLSGLGSLTKEGTGAVTLTGASTFAGNVTVSGGNLIVGVANAYGTATTVTTLAASTTLTVNAGPGPSFGGSIVMNTGSTLNIIGNGNGNFVGNNITIAPGATATVLSTTQTANGYSGIVTFGDASSVFQAQNTGAVSLGLNAINTQQFPGVGTVLIPSGMAIRFSGNPLNNGGPNATFQVDGNLQTRNEGTMTLGALTGGGTVNPGSANGPNLPVTFIIGSSNANSTFSGAISDNATVPTDTAIITKVGTGTLTLTGVNTYTGNTTISNGTIALAGGSIASTLHLNLNSGNFNTGGAAQTMTSTVLHMARTSAIDFGAGRGPTPTPDQVVFSTATGSDTWGTGTYLRVSDWTGTVTTGGGPDQLFPAGIGGTITADQQNHIHFTGYLGASTLITTGVNAGEVVPLATTPTLTLGDVNRDGSVNNTDIYALMVALTDIPDYLSGSLLFPGGSTHVRTDFSTTYITPDMLDVADLNNDNTVNNLDIQAEIDRVVNGPPPAAIPGLIPGGVAGGGIAAVPEPASFVLLGLAVPALGLAWRRRRKNQAAA